MHVQELAARIQPLEAVLTVYHHCVEHLEAIIGWLDLEGSPFSPEPGECTRAAGRGPRPSGNSDRDRQGRSDLGR